MTYILHISNTDVEKDSRIQRELKALSNLSGFSIAAIGTRKDNLKYCFKSKGAVQYHILNIKFKQFNKIPRAIRYIFELIEFTAKVVYLARKTSPRVVHCHDTFALPSGWIIKWTCGCHLVYDAHELESKKNGQNLVLSYATFLIERFCWGKVDLLVSVSDRIIDWYIKTFGLKRAVVILNSPDVDEFVPTEVCDDYFRKKYNIHPDHLVFIYLGGLSYGRGVELVLDAFAALSEKADMVFIGYGELSQYIQSYCDRYGNIHLHEPVPHDQVVSFAKHADVGLCLIENVSLSDYYSLPNKLFEYSFAGLYIVASDFPEIKTIVQEYSLGLTCEVNKESIRDAINYLIEARPVRKNVDMTGLSWKAQSNRLVDSYRDLLQNE